MHTGPPSAIGLPRIIPLFNPFICATLPESTHPSQNIPPFQQIYMSDPPRIYHSLPESTPIFNNYIRPSQYLPLTLRIYPPPSFNKFISATLPEYTPPSQNIPPFSTNICEPPRIYPSLSEYTPFKQMYMCDPPRIHPSLPEYAPLFNN